MAVRLLPIECACRVVVVIIIIGIRRMTAKGRKLVKMLGGLLVGLFCAQLFTNNIINFSPTVRDICDNMGRHRNVALRKLAQQPVLSEGSNNHKQQIDGVQPTMLHGKNLLFVGVMTAQNFLESRARVVFNSWGQTVPGQIMFFSSAESRANGLPLVALEGVDDSYPPQKKSFMMLKYMHDHFLDQFEWFMRADDDVYVRSDRLEDLLHSVDSRKPWFIGQTGRGNTEELGLLSLESDENFCMGGPGVIFSRETLRRMIPHIEECLANLYTSHEDVELGRCVRRFARISCTWSYEMQVIFYHNQSVHSAFTGDLKQKEIHRAITLHPVKHPEHMDRLHKYVTGLRIQELKQEKIKLHRDIRDSMNQLNHRRNRLDDIDLADGLPLFPTKKGSEGYLGDPNLLGTGNGLNRFQPDTPNDILDWELIAKSLYSYRDLNPRKRVGSTIKEGLADVVREVMDHINMYSKQRGRVIDFREISYGYWRLDPVHGVDLILDLSLIYRKYTGRKMTTSARRHAYIQRTFTDIAVREITKRPSPELSASAVQRLLRKLRGNMKPDKEPITFVVPLKGRLDAFRRFLENFLTLAHVSLIVISYPDTEADQIAKLVEVTRSQSHFHGEMSVIETRGGDFARGRAIHFGIQHVVGDPLLVLMDVDMVFNEDAMQRIRWNTVRNVSAYFPIVYSEYMPWNATDHNASGFWRQFGFGIVSLYKSDYERLGGLDVQISGWGYEDVHFFEQAVKSHLRIVRCADPGLVHAYHSVNCDSSLDYAQREMCLGTHANTLGSLTRLHQLYRQYAHLFSTPQTKATNVQNVIN